MMLRGLYVITDEFLIKDEELEKKVELAVLGGAKVVQLRDKNFDYNKKFERAKRILKITRKYNALLIINDDPILAREVNADGVHLGKDEDYYFSFARQMLRNKIIGVSCYGDLERAIKFQNLGADYVVFGSVFPTKTKKADVLKTIEIFKWAKSLLKIPIVAIGGINYENAKILVKMGVDMIAVVSAVFSGDVYSNSKKLSSIFDVPGRT
ncbi:MAG: thiamine phosphate synthase [Candidatus Hydrothermia bacterium]|nr:thiamine phosphate synthase [Candidatus Hydrothermia bacterium]